MSNLKTHEKRVFEHLFNRGGYVLDFNDSTFAEFFREHRINIEEEKYHYNGRSKMKRLRAFWEIEPNHTVAQVLESLLECAYASEDINSNDKIKATKIINRLKGKTAEQKTEEVNENDFLRQEFKDISIDKLKLEDVITEILKNRIKEIEKCLNVKSALATIFLCGSTLEGVLIGVATNNSKKFNLANSAPKDKNGNVLKFQYWTLNSFIDVAKETGFLDEDVKKFSHSLKDFRNYIHPYEQAIKQFNPNEHTAKICFHVLKAAIYQITIKKDLL